MINDENAYVASVQRTRTLRHRVGTLLPWISLFVVFVVFWWLKLTGITLTGEAFCGYESHIHDDNCMEAVLICAEETSADTGTVYTCGLDEHIHTDELCSALALSCTEEHDHGDSCYTMTLLCKTEEHTHTEACTAAAPSDGHIHGESCYEMRLVCDMEEHTHTAACYSDITADLETPADWEGTLPSLDEERTVLEHIVEVARSQLGYTESERNYIIDTENNKYGYTRYGEWYGNPYGDWSVMFTSFCLRYAGLDDVPISSGADTMRLRWEEEDRYRPNGSYTPLAGDIVFLDKNLSGTAEAAAIIVDADRETLYVIEGDFENRVAEAEYSIYDPAIVGYGLSSPDNSLLILDETTSPETELPEETEAVHETEVPEETEAVLETELPEETEAILETAIPEETEAVLETEVPEETEAVLETEVPEETEAILETEVPEETEAILETAIPEETEAILETAIPEETEAVLETEVPEETEAVLGTEVPEETGIIIETEIPEETEVPETEIPETEPAETMELLSSVLAAASGDVIAKTTDFDHNLFTDTNSFVVYTTGANGYYAFDGNGNAVQIYIDGDGNITSDTTDPDSLLWTFTRSGGETSYLIKNVKTGRYMHAYPNNGSGVTTSGAYTSTLITDGAGIKIRSNTEFAQLNESSRVFTVTRSQASAAAYRFGIVSQCAVWLDGTNGGLKCFAGSPNQCSIVESGNTIRLPYEWQSPSKYNYTLRGWYDIINCKYYSP